MSATLTQTEILADVLDSFKIQFPMLSYFSTEFSKVPLFKGQQVIAHIRQLPTASTYDATTGYANGATDAKDLLVDIPITLNQLSHVPCKITYLDAISTQKDKYKEAIADLAFVLGKAVVDYALGKVVAANFSRSSTESLANTTRDTLSAITKSMNGVGAAPRGRFAIVNSDVFNALDSDSRIASGDYHGQRRAGMPYGELHNVAGIENLIEYPSLPTTGNMTGFFGDPRAIIVATAAPNVSQKIAAEFGIPQAGAFETVTDPDSGLSLLGIKWQAPGTFDLYMTVALLYDAVAGKQGGSAGTITDYAGHILKTA